MHSENQQFKCIQCQKYFQLDFKEQDRPLCLVCAKNAGLVKVISVRKTNQSDGQKISDIDSQHGHFGKEKSFWGMGKTVFGAIAGSIFLIWCVVLFLGFRYISTKHTVKTGNLHGEPLTNETLIAPSASASSTNDMGPGGERDDKPKSSSIVNIPAAFAALDRGDRCKAETLFLELSSEDNPVALAMLADDLYWQKTCDKKAIDLSNSSSGSDLSDRAMANGLVEETEQGSAYAQYAVYRLLYDNLIDEERGRLKSKEYYLKNAALNGLPQAEYEYGILYSEKEETVDWYRKAAEGGHCLAQYTLGGYYFDGKFVQESYEDAAKWYTRAAKQGCVEAQYNLGVLYSVGAGVKKDYNLAEKWFEKAADQGHQAAMVHLERVELILKRKK